MSIQFNTEVQRNATQRSSQRERNQRNKVDEEVQHTATQCRNAKRPIREIKSTKKFNVMQQGSARKRNQRRKVNKEVQCKATWRGSARKRSKRKKVDKKVECNATQLGSAK